MEAFQAIALVQLLGLGIKSLIDLQTIKNYYKDQLSPYYGDDDDSIKLLDAYTRVLYVFDFLLGPCNSLTVP